MYKLILTSIIFPIAFGLAILWGGFNKRLRDIISIAIVGINSILAFYIVFFMSSETVSVLSLKFFSFSAGGIARVFAMLIALLWPMVIKKENDSDLVVGLRCVAYGLSLGVCFATNFVLMYLFLEALCAVTALMIVKRKEGFIICSSAASLLLIIGISIFYFKENGAGDTSAFLLIFLGLLIKTVLFPLYACSSSVGVQPKFISEPVCETAVILAGCFSIMKEVYYLFDFSVLSGSEAQKYAVIIVSLLCLLTAFWIVKDVQFQRNQYIAILASVSYILIGTVLMSADGLFAALLHFTYSGIFIVILLYVADEIRSNAKTAFCEDLLGFGSKMPIVFGSFVVASLALVGIPLLSGFASKVYLGIATANAIDVMPWVKLTILAIIVSTMCILLKTLLIADRGFFPGNYSNCEIIAASIESKKELTGKLIILSALCILLCVFSKFIIDFILICMGGLF